MVTALCFDCCSTAVLKSDVQDPDGRCGRGCLDNDAIIWLGPSRFPLMFLLHVQTFGDCQRWAANVGGSGMSQLHT